MPYVYCFCGQVRAEKARDMVMTNSGAQPTLPAYTGTVMLPVPGKNIVCNKNPKSLHTTSLFGTKYATKGADLGLGEGEYFVVQSMFEMNEIRVGGGKKE